MSSVLSLKISCGSFLCVALICGVIMITIAMTVYFEEGTVGW